MKITVATTVHASVEDCWTAWTSPDHITQWNFASDDWCCPRAAMDLQVGGKFCCRMEPKQDSTEGFDFAGEFTAVIPHHSIEYAMMMDDGDDNKRNVLVEFLPATENDPSKGSSTRIVETFDAEDENSAEMQKEGWQNILNNFKSHVEQYYSSDH
jgi:uncharacterized protein YndB with AHSA1/START domain